MELFAHGDLDNYLEQRRRSVVGRIDAIPRDQFLVSPEQQILDHILTDPDCEIEALTLFEDRMQMEHGEGQVAVEDYGRHITTHAVHILISIPYTGTYPLWTLRPNRWQDFPEGQVQPVTSEGFGTVELRLSAPLNANPESIRQTVERTLSAIHFFLDAQREQIEADNKKILIVAREAIQNRRNRLERQEGLVRHLNIPLKTRKGSIDFTPLPIKRTLQRPLPPAPTGGFQPEPGIREEHYQHILGVIRHAGRSFEAAPATFSVHDEESLRDIILAHLNGHYEGDATGETFRRKGKTDIRIEVQDRAAFVGECKVWRGQKEAQKACDQLLDYLTWRDCKTALIVFNRDVKEFSHVLNKLPEAIHAHSQYRNETPQEKQGEWRFVLASRDDPQRLVGLHVFAFNLAL